MDFACFKNHPSTSFRCRVFALGVSAVALFGGSTALLLGAEESVQAKTSGKPGPKRTYVATRVAEPPRIDGKLDDTCWTSTGEWAADFTQYTPEHGGPPTEPTRLKILYDDKNVYVAMRALESRPDLKRIFAGPRDERAGDSIGIAFDTYFDHRTGFEFNLTSAGQKADYSVADDRWDRTWNAVWDGKVSHDETGWSAEMRIPLNQLRYNSRPEQTWGLHAWRFVARNTEESQWQLLGRDGSGLVYSFGELRGLVLPEPRRHAEIVPYVSAKHTSGNGASRRSDAYELAGGLDGKLQLSSSFTLDATINPDFGQVEADPSEMNLTAFETFLNERRPFFLEGKSLLQFDVNGADLFYSRRIGRGPSLGARSDAYDVPESTTILGAWKVTGKTTNGLALGFLHAATDEEHAKYVDASGTHEQSLEPAANYLLARVKQDLNGGNTTVGGIATFTQRSLKTDSLRERLPEQAVVGGLDLQHYWKDRTYFVAAKVIGSHVAGEPAAISRLQTSSARYYQRPDADHVDFDPTRRSLDGWAAQLDVGKGSKGNWRVNHMLAAFSPGVELNDLGFLRQADRIQQEANIAYVVNEPASFYRQYDVALRYESDWDYSGEHLRSETEFEISGELKNKAWAGLELNYTPESLSVSALRGGPALRVPPMFEYAVWYETDSSRKLSAWGSYYDAKGADNSYREESVEAGVKYRPFPALTLSLNAENNRVHQGRQYVSARTPAGQPVHLLSDLKSETLSYTLRVQWFFRPELSLQYYGSPFGSAGSYRGFERVIDGRAGSYAQRTRVLSPTFADGTYSFDDDGDGVRDYSARLTDFSVGEFRSNLVLRWEYRPGSNFYAVWSQGRSERRDIRTGTSGIINRLPNAPVVNVFLLKFSYWFSI